jgi:methyltransferase-like protein/trans-aconitate methyltransferase
MSELIERIGETYDEVPYLSCAFTQTAPEHLHAVAHLFGLATPPPATARVLELGCAAGGNLIPFAARYPQAQAVGVDLSGVQVAGGNRAIRAMELENIQLLQASITELADDIGQFDYIICHGVYSWVPEDVREAILRISRERLTPQGVAYISYNTYPGWKAKEIVRDAMLLRGETRQTPQEKLSYARGMIDFLHDMAHEDSLLKKVMRENIDTIRHGHEHYLAHEFLELCNAPCYFRDFIAAAGRHGLAYLAESDITGMFASNYGSKAAEPLLRECNGSQVALEQLLDFLNNRTFRQTLLVPAERAADIRYQLDSERLIDLHLASHMTLAADGNGEAEVWQSQRGTSLRVTRPMAQQLIRRLNAAWPATVAVATLVREAQAGNDPVAARTEVLQFVEQLLILGMARMRLAAIRAQPDDANRPHVPAPLRQLARLQQTEPAPVSLYNTWHEVLEDPDVVAQVLLPLLDGKHDREALTAALLDSERRHELQFQRDGATIADADAISAAAAEHVEDSLQRMKARALFTVPA